MSQFIKIYNEATRNTINNFIRPLTLNFSKDELLLLLQKNYYINKYNVVNINTKLSSLANMLMKCRNIQKAPICDLENGDYKELMESKRLKPFFCGILKELTEKEPNKFKLQLGGSNMRVIKVLKKY